MDNQKIAEIFQEIGDILEIKGENKFRVLAYQNAAMKIADLGRDLRDIYQENPESIDDIPGIGKDLAAKIVEMLETGKCSFHEKLIADFPKGLLDMLRLRGVGPKKVKLFYSELKIDNIEKLSKAAKEHKLRDLPRMGEKSEEDVLKALAEYTMHTQRMMLSHALGQAEKLVNYVKECGVVVRAQYAGSLRRMKETIGDIDILASTKDGKNAEKVMEHFVKFPEVASVIGQGETKTSVILKSGIQSDLRVVDDEIFGAALHYFTGSKEHNVMIRDRAKRMGLKISEYGVFNKKEKVIAGKTEEEVFKSVGLPYIEPLLRENRGEIEAAEKGKLPTTVEIKDLKGDMHVHSRWSDGSEEIEYIARFYRDKGYDYIAITDHSPSMVVAHGLTKERFEMQWDEIDEINSDLEKEAKKGARPFRILKGVECDILADGKLDLPDAFMKRMDIVVASIHSRFGLSEKEQTERAIKAISNPYVTIFGHPSGRLLNEREPYGIDLERVIDACVKNNVAIEINSQPTRLDLFDFYCKLAKAKGAKLAINTDSHHTSQISYLPLGIAVAKRGWLEKADVINTWKIEKLMQWIKKTP